MASRIKEMFSSRDDPIYRGMDFRSSSNHAYREHHGPLPVVELRVPMCCDKCKEKVQEELEDMDGVRTVVCDQLHQRVTVVGYVDPLRVLKRVKKVKKKSEFYTQGTFINKTAIPSTIVPAPLHRDSVRHDSVQHIAQPTLHRDPVHYAGHASGHQDTVRYVASHPAGHRDAVRVSAHHDSVRYAGQGSGHRDAVRFAGQGSQPRDAVRYAGQPLAQGGPGLTRTNSFERGLTRQPSFGKVTHYDGLRHHDFETRDVHRDYYGIRRMPSFKKHRYHDAEYVSMGDEFLPQHGETHYVRHERPMLQSQVSFSKLPVRNPLYVKPAYHEY